MANIKNSRSKFHERIGRGFDIPSEYVESEGDRLIKDLAEKQANTKISLQQELSSSKEFQSATEFLPVTEFISGQTSLAEFKELSQTITNFEELSSYNLSNEEVKLYKDSQKGIDYVLSQHKNIQQEILNKQISDVHLKIKTAQAERSEIKQKQASVNRQEKELGLCVKPESETTKLYKFALSCREKTTDTRPETHPINNLHQIENDMFSHLNQPTIPSLGKRRKKAKRLLDKKITIKPSNAGKTAPPLTRNLNSKWDKTTTEVKESSKHHYTCAPQRLYTITDGEIRQIPTSSSTVGPREKITTRNVGEFVGSNADLISLDHIKKFRLTQDEIHGIPAFQNYNKGIPHNVLFVKNMPSSVTENDLTSIFGNFQHAGDAKIKYKLMSGRMRGQAFITFCSISRATEALDNVNGYLLKGKPIILQYGKQKI